jgi:cbb3-type cytochrome oxidase maturation protein
MTILLLLIPAALAIGGFGLAAFFWALRTGQFDDPDGSGARFLFEVVECARRACCSPPRHCCRR